MSQFDSIRFQPSRPLLKEVSADRLNAILSEIKKNRPRGERGITVRQAGDATYIGLAAANAKGGSSAAAVEHPWDLLARVDPDADPENPNPPYLVRVRPGTLNGILPSNWDEEFACNATGLYYAKAIIATDGSAITGLTIEINTTAPTVQSLEEFSIATSIEYLFGLFKAGQVHRVIGGGHITLIPQVWLTKDKATPAVAGELPYDLLYRLQEP